MIIAYKLSGHDNGSHFFLDAPDTIFCKSCGTCLDENYRPENLKLKKKYDIGSSYDNRTIVSLRFKEFCEEHYPKENEFYPVTKNHDFFYMKPCKTLYCDTLKMKARFDGLCPICGNYDSVVSPIAGVIKGYKKEIERGFYCTDLLIGSGRSKSQKAIVGLETKLEIEEMCFTKPSFYPVYNEDYIQPVVKTQ